VRRQFEEWLAEMSANEDIDEVRGDRIRELIDLVGTQTSVAKAIDVTPRTVGRWVKGGGIAAEYRAPLAEALGRTLSYVMLGEDNTPEQHVVIAQLDRLEEKTDEALRLLRQLVSAAGLEPPGELGQIAGGSPPKPPRPEQDHSEEEPDDRRDTG